MTASVPLPGARHAAADRGIDPADLSLGEAWRRLGLATPGPVVERSITSRTLEPLMMPPLPPSATA